MHSGRRRVCLLMVLILVTWACVSVGSASAVVTFDQYILNLSVHHPNELILADGVHKAKMNVVLRDKKTTYPAGAPSNIEVMLTSENSTVEPPKVIISKGNASSEDISLTSTRPGIACVKAEAIGFGVATIYVEFVPSPKPDELYLEAHPEIIPANGRDPTNLTVKLLCPNDEPFTPPQDTIIDIWTSTGKSFDLTLSAEKSYGTTQFTTNKYGVINVTAESFDFGLNDSTTVATLMPSKLLLAAYPKNISANGRDPVKLTIRLLCSDGSLFVPPQNTTINLCTSTGKSFDLILSAEMPSGTEQFTTYKSGVINVTAESPDFGLNDSTTVTIVPMVTPLTFSLSYAGGFLGACIWLLINLYYINKSAKQESENES